MSEERTLYEAIYILDVNMPEDQAAELIAAIENAVAEADGEVVGTRDFATRRLAYEIEGHAAGAYKLLYFRGEVPAVEAFKHEAAVRQGVVRARCYVANPNAIVRGDAAEQPEAPSEDEQAQSEAAAAEAEAGDSEQ